MVEQVIRRRYNISKKQARKLRKSMNQFVSEDNLVSTYKLDSGSIRVRIE